MRQRKIIFAIRAFHDRQWMRGERNGNHYRTRCFTKVRNLLSKLKRFWIYKCGIEAKGKFNCVLESAFVVVVKDVKMLRRIWSDIELLTWINIRSIIAVTATAKKFNWFSEWNDDVITFFRAIFIQYQQKNIATMTSSPYCFTYFSSAHITRAQNCFKFHSFLD